MKTLVKIIVALCFTTLVNAQGKYEKGMGQAMSLWGAQKTEEASNLFERIGKVEKENWLPYYYVALVNVTSTFQTKDKSKIPVMLQKAQENLNMAMTYSSENPENMVLQALLHTADMMQDPKPSSSSLFCRLENWSC